MVAKTKGSVLTALGSITIVSLALTIYLSLTGIAAEAATCSTDGSQEQPDICWTEKTPMPTARREIGLAADANGDLYAVGGYDGHGGFLTAVEKYDPETDTWTTKAPLPIRRNSLGLALASNGKLYAVGGFDGTGGAGTRLDEVDEYDPASDTWTTKTPMPFGNFAFGLASAPNGKLYAIGGSPSPSSGCVNTVEEYDPSSDTWTTKTPMPTARCSLGVATAPNGKIYAIGGINHDNKQIATVEEYDPETDTWTTKTPMPTARTTLGVSINAKGTIYAAGGDVGDVTVSGAIQLLDVVEEYDPVADIWRTANPLPVPLHKMAVALAGDGNVYAIGGQTQDSEVVGGQATSQRAAVSATTEPVARDDKFLQASSQTGGLDTTAPTGSVKINDGATKTNTRHVTLDLKASDFGGSGIEQMCISNGSSCTAWEPYSPTKTWTLRKGKMGTKKTVYVRYKDKAGNRSALSKDTIKYAR